ncbi:MAG: DUF4157 domain-containing protein [Bacteroidota bacterium]
MQTYADKNQENKRKAVANAVSQKKSASKSTFQFEDNRPEAIQMWKLKEMANSYSQKNSLQFMDNRPEAIAQRKLKEMMNSSPQNQHTAQFQKMANENITKQEQPIQKKPNNTGLPENLKTGIENLSGYSMDDVKVHYNSGKPAQLNAHAYAQGTDIHVASGQEKHLPHEAWHVVQQKQGRVKPTMQMKSKLNVNDDTSLEKEADVMGNMALQRKSQEMINNCSQQPKKAMQDNSRIGTSVIQGVFTIQTHTPLEGVSYRYLDSAKNHVTELELRNDFINLENMVMPRWHETADFEGGGNVQINTVNFRYIMRFEHGNQFVIFHVDRGDNYKAENIKKTKERYDKSDRKDGDGGGDTTIYNEANNWGF